MSTDDRPAADAGQDVGLLIPDWPAPQAVRAFSTLRCGGVSNGVYGSANLGDHVGDDPAAVAANRARLQAALPGAPRLAWLRQVHGAAAVDADPRRRAEADAQVSGQPGVACAILTADCLPVLFCDRDATRVGAAHAGWRGLCDGVLEATVDALGVAPGRLLAWLGPAISARAFEVGPEVRAAFQAGAGDRAAILAAFSPGAGDRWMADLYQLARIRLAACGVTAVYGGDRCTFSESMHFFSYRRDGVCGRQASLIYLKS